MLFYDLVLFPGEKTKDKALHKECNLIIKYHSRIYREENDIYDQIDKLIIALGAQDSVVTKIDDNILPYMKEADLMISDISTACYEWFHYSFSNIVINGSNSLIQTCSLTSPTCLWRITPFLSNTKVSGAPYTPRSMPNFLSSSITENT